MTSNPPSPSKVMEWYLDHMYTWLEPRAELIEHFCHQLLMLQHLPHFHDPDDGSLDQQLAVFLNVLVSCLLFHLSLGLHRDVYIHPQFLTVKRIGMFDILKITEEFVLLFLVLTVVFLCSLTTKRSVALKPRS